MTTEQIALSEAAFEAARFAYEDPAVWDQPPSTRLHHAIAAYLAAAPVPSHEHPIRDRGEPVAWRYRVSHNQVNWNFWGDSKRPIGRPTGVDIVVAEPLFASLPPARVEEGPRGDGENRMCKISELVAELQETQDRFGDSCVYIRRGGLAWGAVALNRQADDRKHGVFDLQAAHDRAMSERLGQVERLIADRNEWRDRAVKAEAALNVTEPME